MTEDITKIRFYKDATDDESCFIAFDKLLTILEEWRHHEYIEEHTKLKQEMLTT